MKRVLCIRFPNWSVQCLRREVREQMPSATALALHTPFAPQADSKAKPSDVDEDTRYVRAVFPSARGGPAIVAVSMDAWAQGVRPGMPLAEARSMAQPIVPKLDSRRIARNQQPSRLIPPVQFREWQPLRDRATLRSVAELTRRYAPVVGLDEVPLPDSLLLDITGCASLFGGEAGLAESLLRDLRKAGWNCRIAIANSVAIGWALTHAERTTRQDQPLSQSQSQQSQHSVFGRADSRRSGQGAGSESIAPDLPITIVPDGYERQELARLPVASSRLDLGDLEILSHLGIRTLGQLLSLPREDLPSRFSESGVRRVQQLAGAVDEPIVPIPEANPITALWSSDDPALGLNDLRFVLQILTEQIAEQLVRRRVACSSVSCHFRFPDQTQMEVTAGVVKPTQSAELLHEVLCLRVETQATLSAMESSPPDVKKAAAMTSESPDSAPTSAANEEASNVERSVEFLLSQPFHAVRMNVVVTSLPVARQKDLFSPEEHVVPQDELAALISRLSGRLGTVAVRTLRTQPDPRPEFEVVSESVLGKDPALIRQAVLDEKLRKLTEPLQESDLLVGEQSIELRIVSRPLRLLPVPIPISTGERRRNFPTQLLVAGRTFQLRQFSAPERIQTAWWTDEPCHRDYYQVTTHSGSRMWLYRDLHTSQWFLHGVFD